MRGFIRSIHVFAISPRSASGRLRVGHVEFRCALGQGGRSWRKREGDGATPRGRFPLLRCLTRQSFLSCGLPVRRIGRSDGWCDSPDDRNYNRQVRLPYPASCETLWRNDHLYDVVIVLGHNQRPRRRGAGSAVFLHVAARDFRPTAGCIAVSAADMRRLLPRLSGRTSLHIP